jgi:hypothetical protein
MGYRHRSLAIILASSKWDEPVIPKRVLWDLQKSGPVPLQKEKTLVQPQTPRYIYTYIYIYLARG